MDEETNKKNDIQSLISSAKDLKISGIRTLNNDLSGEYTQPKNFSNTQDDHLQKKELDTNNYNQENTDNENNENEIDIDSAEIIRKNNYLEPIDNISENTFIKQDDSQNKISTPVTKIIQENQKKESVEIRSKILKPNEDVLINPVRTFNNNIQEEQINKALQNNLKDQDPPLQIPDSDKNIKVLRTFDDDIKDAVQKDNMSTAKMFIAEQQKRESEEYTEKEINQNKKTNIIKIILVLFFIISGIAIMGFSTFYYVEKNKKQEIPQDIKKSFIEVDSVASVNTSFRPLKKSLEEIRNNLDYIIQLENDNIAKIKLEKTAGVEENGEVVKKDLEITTSEFFSLIKTKTTSQLIRSLDSEMMLGVHNNGGSREPFIIFRVKDFEQAYSNMFIWEKTIVKELQDIFYKKLGSSDLFEQELVLEISKKIEDENSTNTTSTSKTEIKLPEKLTSSTSSSSSSTTNSITTSTNPTTDDLINIENQESEITNSYDPTNFVDLIILNKDTRAILNKNGDLLFFYSFIDKENLIITTNQQTLNILMKRIANSRMIK